MNKLKTAASVLIGAYLLITIVYVFQKNLVQWDEQQVVAFTQNQSVVAYNVSAVVQSDSNGNGPAYLVNGLSDTGYWYQIGLTYNWTFAYGNTRGFSVVYEVFDPNGYTIAPSGGGGGFLDFNGTINSGDKVLLKLYFSNGNVTMFAKDWKTGSTASFNYSAENAATFIGTPRKRSINGTFTGLMTEWYHLSPDYPNEKTVRYQQAGGKPSSAWLLIDELVHIDFLHRTYLPIFVKNTSQPVSPYQNYTLRSHNITSQYLSDGTFITGSN